MTGTTTLTFKIYKGDQFLREESLSLSVIKIGKLSSSQLRLEDDSVSRMHAVIEVTRGGEISIIDLGSAKGTLVNGEKINKASLSDGDEVVLGDLRLVLSVEVREAEAEAPSPASRPDSRPGMPGMPGVPAMTPPPGVPVPARISSPPPIAPPSSRHITQRPPAFGSDAMEDKGGARAIEVAAMLEDSVIAVKHVTKPEGGKVTAFTKILFALGAVLLLVSAVSFIKGISTAADNHHAYESWIEQNKPEYDFRPSRMGLYYDVLGFGGAAGSLFCFVLGLVRFRNERVQPYFRIGRAPDVDFPTSDSPEESFPLVAPKGSEFVFNFSGSMTGEMMFEGQSTPLADLVGAGRAKSSAEISGATEVPIPHQARFRVKSGNQTFMVSSVPEPKKQPVPLFAALDRTAVTYLVSAILISSGMLALLLTTPPDPSSLALDGLDDGDLLASIETNSMEDPLQEEPEEDDGDTEDSGGTGEKQALDEGKMGKEDVKADKGQYAMKDNDAEPQLSKEKALDDARNAGFLGQLNSAQGGAFASLTASADFSSGTDDLDVYGGLTGNEVGEASGGFGYGVSGVGPGGGGTGWGTLGRGRVGKIGHGAGSGSGFGSGSGRGGLAGRKARALPVKIGSATSSGGLDKAIIRRYIRKKLPQIKNCYEKQLQVKQDLRGTVVSQFQISPTGVVQGSSASGLGDNTVESCVSRIISTIQFPKPKGGTFVNVRYPFNMSSQ